MRVLLLAENWPPRVGGIENYLSHIADLLPSGSVTVIAPRASAANDQARKGAGIRAVWRRKFFWPLIRPAWLPLYIGLHRRLRREPVDVIVCGKALFEGQAAYYLKRYLGIPYVVCTYAMEIETWAQSHRRRLQRVLKAADRVVYINEVTKQTLLSLGVQPRQLIKIWPGVDDGWFTAPQPAAIQKVVSKYHLQQPYILAVSRLVPRKGIDQLIEAFAALDQTKFGNVSLVIVGSGPEAARLASLAEQSFLGSSVRLLGSIPTTELPLLYAGATLFALTPRELPSDYEGFGIVYLEAAAHGLPAVATATGGAGEAVVHNQTGLVGRPDSIRDITQALAQLLSDTALHHRLGRQARERAWEEFRWSKRILLVKGMLDAVIAEHKRA